MSICLLPGALPRDRATLAALCEDLPVHAGVAARLAAADVEPFAGSWSDAERVALGSVGDLPAGLVLAASLPVETRGTGTQFAVASPLSAALGLSDLTVLDPDTLQLTGDDSRALCEACDAHLAAEGLRLIYIEASRWLLCAGRALHVLSESPRWLVGEMLRPNLPRGADARLVERWMNELQMLLYTHPVNIAREDRALAPVNIVWLWGFGTDAASASGSHNDSLHMSALRNGDPGAWQAAWATREREILAASELIIGDSHPRWRLRARAPGAFAALLAKFRKPPPLGAVLAQLQSRATSVA